MDLASKFDTGAAKEALKRKLKGAKSSPERYKAETQSNNIKNSLLEQKKGYRQEADDNYDRSRRRASRVRAANEKYISENPDSDAAVKDRARKVRIKESRARRRRAE